MNWMNETIFENSLKFLEKLISNAQLVLRTAGIINAAGKESRDP